MEPTDSKYLLYGSHWPNSLALLLWDALTDLLICAPYITMEGATFVKKHTTTTFPQQGKLLVVTNLSAKNMAQGATDPNALRELRNHFPNFNIWTLPNLHAKVYMANGLHTIVTSANLTRYGLDKSLECGARLHGAAAGELRNHILQEVSSKGEEVSSKLDQLAAFAEELKAKWKAATSNLLIEFEESMTQIEETGTSRNALFQKEIKHLLGNEPMKTPDMHPLLKAKYPLLCDDELRDSNGEIAWQHAVRAAQEALQKKGEVKRLTDGLWTLGSSLSHHS